MWPVIRTKILELHFTTAATTESFGWWSGAISQRQRQGNALTAASLINILRDLRCSCRSVCCALTYCVPFLDHLFLSQGRCRLAHPVNALPVFPVVPFQLSYTMVP